MDPNSFGQLIPLFLISLSIFTFIQVLAENADKKKEIRDKKHAVRDSGDGQGIQAGGFEKETQVKEETKPVSNAEP